MSGQKSFAEIRAEAQAELARKQQEEDFMNAILDESETRQKLQDLKADLDAVFGGSVGELNEPKATKVLSDVERQQLKALQAQFERDRIARAEAAKEARAAEREVEFQLFLKRFGAKSACQRLAQPHSARAPSVKDESRGIFGALRVSEAAYHGSGGFRRTSAARDLPWASTSPRARVPLAPRLLDPGMYSPRAIRAGGASSGRTFPHEGKFEAEARLDTIQGRGSLVKGKLPLAAPGLDPRRYSPGPQTTTLGDRHGQIARLHADRFDETTSSPAWCMHRLTSDCPPPGTYELPPASGGLAVAPKRYGRCTFGGAPARG